MKRVAIYTHPRQDFDDRFYLARVAELWRRDGLDVRVIRGAEDSAGADVALPHLRLSVMPPDYAAALRRCPRALNARVLDISKRRYSRLALKKDDVHDGAVIVKTDRNAHGLGEALLGAARVYDYDVYASPADVPDDAWSNPDLIVERFEPELRDGLFWLRTWDFLGDRESGFLYASEHPVAKSERLEFRGVLDDVPEELRALRAEMGFDFGSFDYGVQDGSVFLYDVNWTPGFHDRLPAERARALARTLADGLRAFL